MRLACRATSCRSRPTAPCPGGFDPRVRPMPDESPTRVSVAVGAGALAAAPDDAVLVLDLGADHPSTHGGLRLTLTLDGDRIATADPRIGFVHRGAEKLF